MQRSEHKLPKAREKWEDQSPLCFLSQIFSHTWQGCFVWMSADIALLLNISMLKKAKLWLLALKTESAQITHCGRLKFYRSVAFYILFKSCEQCTFKHYWEERYHLSQQWGRLKFHRSIAFWWWLLLFSTAKQRLILILILFRASTFNPLGSLSSTLLPFTNRLNLTKDGAAIVGQSLL